MLRNLVAACLLALAVFPSHARGLGSHAQASFAHAYKAPYIGQVATRTKFPDSEQTGSGFTANNRTSHYARDTIHSIQVWWTGKYIDATGVEQNGPGSNPVQAYVEYPQGSCHQLLFGGSTTGTIPSNGTLASDFLNIYIPKGALFWVRLFGNVFTAFSYNDSSQGPVIDSAIGDAADGNTSNEGATCSAVAQQTDSTLFPMMIVGKTTRPSFEIVGDSRAVGVHDTFTGTSGDIGNFARTIGPQYAYANFARAASNVNNFATGVQTQVQKYFSHVIQERGGADLLGTNGSPTTPAQTEAAIATVYGLFPGRNIYQSTFEANTTSTDGWTTTTNQTPTANNGSLTTIDGAFLNNVNQPRGVIDVTNALNSSRTSGLWGVLPGATPQTNDGTHCIQAGCINIVTLGVINNNRFMRQSPGRTN